MVIRNLVEFAIIAGVWVASLELLKLDVLPAIAIAFFPHSVLRYGIYAAGFDCGSGKRE